MRFVLRLLSLFAIAVAVIMAVVDATRSIAAAQWTLTPLGRSWQAASPTTFGLVEEAVQHYAPLLWDPVFVYVLSLPGWLVFAVLSFLLYAMGHRRQRVGRFSSATW